MAGPAPLSLNTSKQYGDQQLLDSMKSQTKTPSTGVTVPAQQPGRPRESGQQQAQPQGQPQAQPQVDPQHKQMIDSLAQAARTAQILAQKASEPGAGPWLRYYAEAAAERYQSLAVKVKSETPFFTVQG